MLLLEKTKIGMYPSVHQYYVRDHHSSCYSLATSFPIWLFWTWSNAGSRGFRHKISFTCFYFPKLSRRTEP